MKSDEINELAAALVNAQGEFRAIPKTDTNPFFKSKYAGLASVVETASPVLEKNGLAVSQFISYEAGGGDTLTTWLIHKSGQYLCDTMKLKLGKEDAQGQGSAVTYARRYAYMAVLGLVADEDDDGNKATAAAPKTTTRPSYTKPIAVPVREMVAEADKQREVEAINKAGEVLYGPTPEEQVAEAINGERIHENTLTKMIGALRLKGITGNQEVADVLNGIAKNEYEAKSVRDLDEIQAQVIYKRLIQPTTKKEDLLKSIDPFAPIS